MTSDFPAANLGVRFARRCWGWGRTASTIRGQREDPPATAAPCLESPSLLASPVPGVCVRAGHRQGACIGGILGGRHLRLLLQAQSVGPPRPGQGSRVSPAQPHRGVQPALRCLCLCALFETSGSQSLEPSPLGKGASHGLAHLPTPTFLHSGLVISCRLVRYSLLYRN